MTEGNARVIGYGTIIAIVIVVAAATGAVLGKFGERLGITGAVRSVIGVVIVLVLVRTLLSLRAAALRRQDSQ